MFMDSVNLSNMGINAVRNHKQLKKLSHLFAITLFMKVLPEVQLF